jgi:hypothetical protein
MFLKDVEFGNTSTLYGISNCNFISNDILNGNNNFVDRVPQGLFDIFSVNRKDSLFQLLATVHLDKHVNLVGDCKNDSLSHCYFADCFNKKSALYFNDINVALSHYVALLSRFCDLECFSSRLFINICTYYVIFGVNICTFVNNDIDLPEKFLGTSYYQSWVVLPPLFPSQSRK